MEYRPFGRTGMKVSPICLGCMTFGGATSLDDTKTMIGHAIETGINFLDTANVYHRGVSEEYVGQALKQNHRREALVLATKVHGRMADDDPNMLGNSRRHIMQQCEASLRRLQTDWIDMYQIHRPDSQIPIDETLRALDDLIRQGKVRYIGTSTFAAWQVLEALWVSDRLNLNRFVSEQPPYHMLDRRVERELVPMAQTHGIGIIPWSPLASGFLTGKYDRENMDEAVGRLAGSERLQKRFSEACFDAVEALKPLAENKGCSLSQLALAWCMNQPGITSPIIGPRTLEQLQDNLGALDVTLNDKDREAIDAVCPPGRALATYYQADFGPHAHRV